MGRVEKPSTSVIIVGAGAGGVATAARLAKAGYKVTVLEKNDFTGGRCSLIHRDGYRFDQGPSLLLLPRLFRETFEDLDTTLEDEGVQLVKCEPNYSIHFHDDIKFQMSTDLATMKREVERFEGIGGYERYLSFLQEAHKHYEHSITHVLRKNFFSFWSMLRLPFLPHLLELHPFESIYGRATGYFKTERLRRVFTFASMYMGMSPFEAPGTYSLLQYTELAEGIWYPIGGFWKVVEALVNIGQRQGVEYRMNTNISEIVLSDDGKRAKGVRLADTNEVLEADIVICNADLIYAYNNLLPETSYSRHLATRKPSCSSLSFYWALDRKFPEFSAHNIFLAEKYQESFDSIFKKQELPDEPSFYVNVPSRIDPSASPEGCDTMVVLVPVGYMLDSNKASDKGTKKTTVTQDWDAMVATARRSVLRIIETRLKISLEDHIKHESVNTPPSWNERFNLDRGAILGLSHDFFNVLAFRPKTKHPSISDLFFVGASTHPGTGVPIVLAGAKLVSEQILEERGVSKPWLPAIQSQGRGEMSELDRSQWWPWIEWFNWFLMGLSALFAWAVYLLVKSVGALDWSKGSTRMLAGDW